MSATLRQMLQFGAAGAARRSIVPNFQTLHSRPIQAANSSGYGRRRGRKEQLNTVINFVPQQEAWVVERFGKFHDILEPGLRILYPVVDVIKYVHTLKEIVIEIPSQSGITQDNVTMHLDAVIYIKIDNPYKASYGVEDPEYAVAQLAQTTMRSELGQLKLDEVFKERATLNWNIVEAINEAAIPWGLKCLRCEIKDIALPDTVVEDMQRQVSAERRKRASVLESEGKREAAVNIAEGDKTSQILASEAERKEQVNQALGEAEAIEAKAIATANAIKVVAEAIQTVGGDDAVKMKIARESLQQSKFSNVLDDIQRIEPAEDYVAAFGNIAKEGNTMLIPANAGEPAGMIAQALSIYDTVKTK